MRLISRRSALMALPLVFWLVPAAFSQSWEVGVDGGWGFSTNKTVTRNADSATVGFEQGYAFGAWATQHLYDHISGEARYTFGSANPKISSGGASVTFSGQTHAIHYDVLLFGAPREARIRPYAAIGAGIKVFRGTASEMVVQPLSTLAVYTRATDTKPMISVGGGVEARVGKRTVIRFDVRDYVTPFPDKVIAPLPQASLGGGWIHDFVALVGVGTTF